MALQVGELFASLDLNSSKFNSGMAGAEGKFSRFGKTVGVATAAVVAAAGAATAAVAGMVGYTGIAYNAMMETSSVAWETILGDAKKAEDTIKLIEKIGAATPFEFEGLDKTSKLLTMSNLGGKELESNLIRVGDAVSAVGGNQETLEGVAMALFQMSAKGKVSAEEMNQMAERGLPVWDMLSKAMGKSVPELMKMSEGGELMADVALPKLLEGFGRFDGAMEKSSKTFDGMKSTMMDNIKIVSGLISKDLFESIKKGLPVINDFLSGLAESIKQNGVKEAILGIFPPQMQTVINSVITWVQGFLATLKESKGTFDQYKEMVIESFQVMWGVIGPVMTFIKDAVMDAVTMIVDWWKSNGSELLANVQIVFNGIWAVIGFIMPLVLWIVESVWNNVKGVIHGALNIISGLFKIFAGLFTGDMSKMWEGVKQLFFGAIEFIWNGIQLLFVGKIIGSIKTFAVGLKSLFMGIGRDTIWAFKSMWANVVKSVTGFKDTVIGAFNAFRNMGLGIFNSFKGTMQIIWEGIKQAVFKVATNLYIGIQQRFTTAYNIIRAIVTGIKDFMTGGIKNAVTTVINGFKSLVSFIGSARSSIISTIVGMVKSIASTFLGLIKSARGWGKDVMVGFLNGITNGAKAVFNKAREIAGNVAKTIKGALKINSPSKITTELGEWTGMGIEVGLDKSARGIMKAAGKIAKAAVPKIDRRIPAPTLAVEGPKRGYQTHVTVPVNIDGKEVAKVTTKHISRNQFRARREEKRSLRR